MNGIAMRHDDAITLTVKVDESRVDSRLLAARMGKRHQDLFELVKAHRASFERFGVLRFQTGKPTNGRPEKFALLTEDQAYFLLTLTRNTARTVALKVKLVQAFSSATVINEVAELSLADPKPLIALYVGDFDPSGMYMSEADLPARLERYGGKVSLRRIALLPEDTARLPSFDAATKTGDSRHRWFVERYGPRCWELDAMPPPELRARVEQEIKNYIEPILWSRAVAVEAVESDSMRQFFNTWQEMRAGGAL